MIGVLVGLLIAAPSNAYAAEWWIVLQRDAEGNVHFGDASQMIRQEGTVTFWSHLFYKKELDGMKSARIQYEVDCARFSIRERRFLDFDGARQVIQSGDNTAADGWKEVAPDTSGASYVAFACSKPTEWKSKHLRVDEAVDLFEVAEFFLSPSPVVEIPQK